LIFKKIVVYKTLIRPFLFLLSPEKVHSIVVNFLKFLYLLGITKILRNVFFSFKHPSLKRNVFGIEFENPVGLAAGFDKDANLIDVFSDFGFGFIEIGTLTPRAQPGNPKPRLFRLVQDQALINRMGFNNEGVEKAIQKLKIRKSRVIVGGNIGKNKITPNEGASEDYVYYFVVNISSPNTPDLRDLQSREPLQELLGTLQDEIKKRPEKKPLLLKIAPDLSDNQLIDIIDIVNGLHIDGIVATNTTISRENLKTDEEEIRKIKNGGLSGKPIRDRSTEIIRFLKKRLDNNVPIIGVGGIMNPSDAIEKIEAGASLVQVYTGFIYEGPALINDINKALINRNFD
jgi:dihydroorotate dehydrogenase